MDADAPTGSDDTFLHDASDDGIVRAAGGVVMRPAADHVEVLLVHRPRYDDWTFPKGKARQGEPDEVAALREVEEETGYRCTLGPEVARTSYVDEHGRGKSVRYWVMTVDEGAFAPNDEVDVVVWLPPESARQRLSYDLDRTVLDLALA
ncbi:MAG TPA: NUDIX hydrolase [Acidimicrobiales bacterium]